MKLWIWVGSIQEHSATAYRCLQSAGWHVAASEAEAIGYATIYLKALANQRGGGWRSDTPTVKEIDAEEMRKALRQIDEDAAQRV